MGRNRKRRAKRGETPEPQRKLAVGIADAICDDLPDGAYWAMMEELTGMEPVDMIDDDGRQTGKPRRR